MRPFQVFAQMSPERAVGFCKTLGEGAPIMLEQAVIGAAAAMKARPGFLKKQPFEKRANAVRRALARVSADDAAEEMLAIYFLECRKELLLEWLDAVGVEHEEGSLKEENPAEPEAGKLAESVKAFREGEPDVDRELLLQAFAAQRSIHWPGLESMLEGPSAS